MKIHPVVGAEILERVQFPYPVVPIVTSHHEKLGRQRGIRCGLKGEADSDRRAHSGGGRLLDALASDRQYRRALPLDKAMEQWSPSPGKSFDPKVVERARQALYRTGTNGAGGRQEKIQLSTDVKISNGARSGGRIRSRRGASDAASVDFLESIAAARQEVQALFELAQDLGNSLSLDETLSVLAVRLRRMIPYDAMAIYVRARTTCWCPNT